MLWANDNVTYYAASMYVYMYVYVCMRMEQVLFVPVIRMLLFICLYVIIYCYCKVNVRTYIVTLYFENLLNIVNQNLFNPKSSTLSPKNHCHRQVMSGQYIILQYSSLFFITIPAARFLIRFLTWTNWLSSYIKLIMNQYTSDNDIHFLAANIR